MALGLSNILQAIAGGVSPLAQARQGMGPSSTQFQQVDPNAYLRAEPQAVTPDAIPTNVMQSLGDVQPPAQMMQQPDATSGRPRRSLVDIIGRIADGIAVVGGAPAQYQPTLDAIQNRENAAEDRMRQIDLDALRKQQAQMQLKSGGMAIEDDERGRLATALGAVADNPDALAMWPQIAKEAGISDERAAQVGQYLTQNPQAAKTIAQSLGYAAPKQASQAKELQIYGLLQQENPEAAQAYLQSLSNPDSMTPYQKAMLDITMKKFQQDIFEFNNPQPTPAMRNAAAGIVPASKGGGGAGGGSDDVNAILTDFNIKLNGKDDPVADLINGSTSGYVESITSLIPGALGRATPGRENIGKLETIDNALVLALAGGKLGAGVSNADRDFFKEMSGKISDPTIPANQRLAGWEQIKSRLRGIQRRAAQPAARPAARPAKPQYQPSPNRKPVPSAGNAAAIAEARRRGLIK